MGQLAVIDRTAPALPSFTMSDVERIALAIAKGGLFGSNDPNAVLTLCMLAQAEGQHPAVVFRDYDIIQGKPSKKAKAMLADFFAAGGKVVWNRLDDECADATFSHPQGGEITINWTMARAQKAGLGGKEMWKKYPRQMLRSRVVSEGVSTVFPGATSGLYVPEEVMDFDDKPTPPAPQAQRARDLKQIEARPTEAENPSRAKAEAWLAQYAADLRGTNDRGAVQQKAEKALAKLHKEHPDLYARALNLAAEPSQPTADGDPADANPTGDGAAAVGRDDSDMGEAVTLASAKDMIGQQTEIAEVNRLFASLEHGFDARDRDELQNFAAECCDAILRESA